MTPKVIQTIHEVSNSNSTSWMGDSLQVVITIPYLKPGMKIRRSGSGASWNLSGAPLPSRDPQIYEVIEVFHPSSYDYDSLLMATIKLYQNPNHGYSWSYSKDPVTKIFIIENKWRAYPGDKDSWTVI